MGWQDYSRNSNRAERNTLWDSKTMQEIVAEQREIRYNIARLCTK